jgi:hypothetical protein
MAQKQKWPRSPKMPTSSSVKIDRELFEDIWWTCRCEKRDGKPLTPAQLLSELAAVGAAARAKRYEAAIHKLAKIDAEEAQVVSKAQDSPAK